MKFSEQWLREWVNPSLDTHELVAQITMAGLEVDGVEPVAGSFHGVCVGLVKSVDPHPDAEKLSVCQVSTGSDVFQVVCGARNVRPGMKVPFATIGAVLPGDFEIKKARLRGIDSMGMLCAAAELGLAEASDGLLELPDDAPVGDDFHKYFKSHDRTIEVDLTPNRSDCLSVMGLAREVGVLNRLAVEFPEVELVEATSDAVFPVRVLEPSACPRYVGRVIKNVRMDVQTPLWMQEKLRRCGLRSIDPVVDVTNFVMLEMGQPMHAFDLDELNTEIQVRLARSGEQVVLLDGTTVDLRPDTLVIADARQVLAIAGVMGGEHSGVSKQTRHVFLECAFFAPLALAGKARSYGLHTDSSHRFERGVDFQLQVRAVERATALLVEVVGGDPGPVVELADKKHLPHPPLVELRYEKIEEVLGVHIERMEVEEILTRLEFRIEKLTKDGWLVRVPAHRFDVSLDVDLVEEIGRVYGYNNLPVTEPLIRLGLKPSDESVLPVRRLRQHLVALGYQEAVTYSFVDPKVQKLLEPNVTPIALANPISVDLSVMRTSLWAGLVGALVYNQNRQQTRVRLFETGLRFLSNAGDIQQQPVLSALVYGSRFSEGWAEEKRSIDFFDVKADVEALLQLAGGEYLFKKGEHSALHPGQTAEIWKRGKQIGWVGALHPGLYDPLDVDGPIYLFELCLNTLVKGVVPSFTDISKMPEVRRDLAVVVKDDIESGAVFTAIREAAGDHLVDLRLFDVYSGKGIEPGYKSLAIGLTWKHPTRTLQDEEIARVFTGIVENLERKCGGKLRS